MGDIADMYGEDAIYNGTFDGDMNPGYIEAPGGWCVPAEQAPEPFTFPRIQRGGIKYPTPKGNAMPGKITKENSEALAIAAAAKRIAGEQLIEEANELDKRAALIRRPEPRGDWNRWVIDVRFAKGGMLYTYLVLRAGRRYYTTGTGDDRCFSSWKAFVAWLDEKTVEHSAMIPLESNYRVPAALEGKRS